MAHLATGAYAQVRWPQEKAWEWYNRQPWLVGCNFVPSTAANDVELWQAETFDAETIDKELAIAASIGFNTCRVFLNFAIWDADPEGLNERFERFLSMAARHGMTVMPVLFDDCNFAGEDPVVGKRWEPVQGVSNGCWVPSPAPSLVRDPSQWGSLEAYVKDLVGRHARDIRVVVWDLYNEPGNSGLGNDSIGLVKAAFVWARETSPSQPLTAGVWGGPAELTQLQLDLSDITSFHYYGPHEGLKDSIERYKALGRPVVCTEWLARTRGARWESDLPLLRRESVGCYSWGLVNGRTQTHYDWASAAGSPEPSVWLHDLFRLDGTPYDVRELQVIGIETGALHGAFDPTDTLSPTSQDTRAEWRYTFDNPGAGWSEPGYDDSVWAIGHAPFGAREPDLGRDPGTAWTTGDIWLRREVELTGADLSAALVVHHDDDATVYVNGVLAAEMRGYNASYERVTMTAGGRAALRPGRNLLAVHCQQQSGGQYIDLGIIAGGEYVDLPRIQPLFDFPVRDTSICLGPDGVYYLTGTTGWPTWWQTNEGIRVWRSGDLRSWEPLGLVWGFERDGTWQRPVKEDRRAVWAPEIHYLKGTFWLTYCLNWPGGGTGILRSTTGRAEGPYEDVSPDGPITAEIDASLFEDDDGAVYFLYQNGKIARMRDDMTGLAEEPRLLVPSNAPHVGFEGAAMAKIDGRYHLICAEFLGDPPQYHCMAASAESVYGPYGPRYLAVPHGGHNVFFRDRDGSWWSTFFGNDALAPFRERPAILRIGVDHSGRVRPTR